MPVAPGAQVSMLCASHSPLMYCYAREPEAFDAIERVFAERAEAVKAFNPELVFVFGPDHYNGFFMKLMPSFCIGTKAHSVNDIGGFAGVFDVPEQTARDAIRFVRDEGVDVAGSYDMVADHGFSQTMHRMLGGLDSFPVIPVFVSSSVEPYVPFARSRMLGTAIGKFAQTLNKRVLLLGSGGMSHNPLRYYPTFGTGEPEVTEYQLHGGASPKGLSSEAWLKRLLSMHEEGAHMLIDGRRTMADIKLNPPVDREFLDILTEGRLADCDAWNPVEKVEQAGIGFLELHCWLAAAAAAQAAGAKPPVLDIYAETMEYGIALGIIHTDP